MVWTQKSQEIGIKFTITDCSNFDKWYSGAHFVSFLFYYYCNLTIVLLTNTADSKPRCTRSIRSSPFIWTLLSIIKIIVGLKLSGIVFFQFSFNWAKSSSRELWLNAVYRYIVRDANSPGIFIPRGLGDSGNLGIVICHSLGIGET